MTDKVLHYFCPTAEQIAMFLRGYNGVGFEKFRRWMLKANIPKEHAEEYARDSIAESIEGSLIAFFQSCMSLKQGEHIRVLLTDEHEETLCKAIIRRTPTLTEDEKSALARSLLAELKSVLGDGVTLLVDGGAITLRDGFLIARVYNN